MTEATSTYEYQYTARQAELVEIYDLCRSALLNVYYYGRRARVLSRWNLSVQIVSALGSVITLAGLLASVPRIWLIISGIAAVCVVILPLFHLTEKIATFERLHFAYDNIYRSLDLIVKDIRVCETLKESDRPAIALLFRQYASLGPLDEMDFDRKLRDTMQEEVNQIIPPERLWLPYDDDEQQTSTKTQAAGTTEETGKAYRR